MALFDGIIIPRSDPLSIRQKHELAQEVCTMVEHFTVIDAAPSGLWVVT